MKKYDLKAHNQISILTCFLSVFHEEVISDDDYLFIQDKNPNDGNDLRFISDKLLKTWFFEYAPVNRDKIMYSINFVINGNVDSLDAIFKDMNFGFDYEIENKTLFLIRVKNILEEYIRVHE